MGKGFGINAKKKKKPNHTMNYVVMCKHNCAFTPLELYESAVLTDSRPMPSMSSIEEGIQQSIEDGMLIDLGNGQYRMKELLSDQERIDLMIECNMLVRSPIPRFRK